MKELDIRTKSYLYGLFLSDGYFLSQKNKITGMGIELSARDKDLINKLVELFPEGTVSFRHRDTNYKKDYESCVFSCYRKDFADVFIQMGIPIKNKSEEAHSPIVAYSEVSFWRGVIDGNGSLGNRATGKAFLSLTTKSEKLKNEFCNFLHKITKKVYSPNRDQRDNIYNIGCSGKSAQLVIKVLYEDIQESDIYLNRKYEKMKEALYI